MNNEGFVSTGIVLGPDSAAPPPGPVPASPSGSSPSGSPSGSPYDDLINQAAQENNLDPVIFRRQLYQESKLDPGAIGPPTKYGRAQGIAQFMPKTAKGLGIDPMDPEQAIRGSAKMMRQLLNANNESYPLALAGYNWGSWNLKHYGFDKRPDETRKYINNIMGPEGGSRSVVGMTPPPVAAPAAAAPPVPAGAMAMQQPADGGWMSTGIVLPPDQPQQPQPQQPLGGDWMSTGIVLPPEAPQQEAPPWYDLRDVPGSLMQGITDATREAGQLASGQAFTDQPQPQTPQQPRSYVGEAMYGIGHSSPMIATGIMGGLGGAAVGGPIGAMAGTALGMGGTAALQALVPGFKEGRAQGMEPDQAVDYAYRRALTEGGISAATAPIFGLLELAPVKSAVAKWMLANVVAQPAVGLTTRVVEPAVTGDKPPTAEELLRGAGQDIIAGATFSAGHALANRVLPQRQAPGRAKSPAEMTLAEINQRADELVEILAKAAPGIDKAASDELRGLMREHAVRMRMGGGDATTAEPGPAVPAAAVQQHVERRSAALKDATTPDEITEREYLTKNANNPEALAQFYGVTLAPDAAQGEAAREPIASAALPAATASAVSSENAVSPDQLAGRSQPARGAGDEGGDTRIAARAAGEGILGAEAARTDGNVQSLPGEEGVAARNVLAPRETAAKPKDLVVARKMPDGSIRYGKPGEIHADLLDEQDSKRYGVEPDLDSQMGFATEAGAPFMSRDEAHAWVSRNQPGREGPKFSTDKLEGATYNATKPLVERAAEASAAAPEHPYLQPAADAEPGGSIPQRFVDEAKKTTVEISAPDGRTYKGPIDASGVWFLDGEKPVYFYANPKASLMGPRAAELNKYEKVSAQNGETVWFKPGERLRAEKVLATYSEPGREAEFHRTLGKLLGYSHESVEGFIKNHPGLQEKPPAERAAEATAAPPVEGEKSRELNSGVKSQPTAASELGQAPGQARGQVPGQAERPGQVGQAEEPLSPETLPLQKPDQRRVTSPLEDASAPEQGELFRDEQPAAAGEITPEEAPIDVKTAKRPQDQLRLDALNAQLDKLKSQPGDHGDQIAKLTATRDKLVPQDLLAKRQPPPKRPVNAGPPKALGAEKDFLDYKYENGTPVYRDAFVEHAIRKMGMSQDQAEAWVDQGINLNIDEQVTILRDQVKDKFHFPDVALDPHMSDYDKRNFLLDFHRAAQDMMHALGLPVEMASLMGKVRLELNAIGKKTPFGSYSPTTKTIAVHGRANVFGHEWGHALDHEIADFLVQAQAQQQNPGYLATQLGRAGLLSPTNSMAQRIGHLINTLFHDKADLAAKRIALQIKAAEVNKAGTPTLAAMKAQAALKALETGTGVKGLPIKPSEYRKQSASYGPPSYWANEAELLARSIEAYIARIMEQAGVDPRGVVLPDEAYLSNNDQRLRMTFPKQQERADIFAAIDHVMDGYRQTALAGSPRAAQASRGGISDPKNWGKTAISPYKMGPIKTLIYRMRNLRDTLSRTSMTDPTRPDPGGNHALRRAGTWASSVFNSRMGVLEGLHELVTDPRAKAALQSIMDRLGHTVGKGRYTGWDPLEDRAYGLTKKAMSQFSQIMTRAGMEPEHFTKEQGDHLRHVMTTGEGTYPVDPLDPNSRRIPIDPKIIAAAGPLRTISDRFFQELKDAGIDIGYAKNGHYLRLYDQVRAHKEPAGFIKAASTLHKLMFDREVGNAGDSPDKLYEQWKLLNDLQRRQADPSVQSAMQALEKNLEQQRNVEYDMKTNGVTAAKQAQYLRLQQDAEQLALAHHDPLGEYVADINAHTWLNNLRTNYAHDFEHNGPGGNFLNKRTLPPEADRIMRDYMITDPMTVLPRYYESAARKIAYAERFGAKGEIRKQFVQDMIDGGMEMQDIHLVEKIIDSVSGRTNNEHSRGLAKAANWIHAGAALGLLGRSAYSTMAEPFVIALSQGSMRAGLKSFGAVFGNIMRTGTARERAQLADFIGITTSAIQDDIMMNRVSADYSDSPMLGKFMSRYYRTIGLTQMTNWNRRASMAGGDWLLNKYARDILNPSKGARASDARDIAKRALNEFGIAPELHEEFSKWKASLNGMPSIDTVDTHRFGGAYARAMRRIVDRSVIDPKKIERPLATEDKWMGLLFQFQSFNYGFQRNVLDPMMRRIGHAYTQGAARGGVLGGGANAAWALSHTGAIVGSYVAINMLTTAVRQFLFNRDDWDKHEADDSLGEYITDLAMQRSGLGGTLDPVTQLVTNLRYNQDLASLLEGPGIKWIAKNGYDVLMGAVDQAKGQEAETNTRPHEMVKGLYNLIGIPLEAIMATKLSAFGPLGNLAGGAAYQYLSSPQAAEDASTAVTGPKGASLAGGGAADDTLGGLDTLDTLDKLDSLDSLDDAEGGTGAAGQEDLGIAGSIPWGLADDFIAPLWKVTKPVMGMIPKSVKAAAAAGGAAYYGTGFWNRMEPYRNAPAPPPK